MTTGANATPMTFTGNGTLDSKPVSAQATFTPGAGYIDISVINLIDDPTSVIQNLSDLHFMLGTTPSGTSSVGSSAGLERTVNADPPGPGEATYTDGSTVAAGWILTTLGPNFTLDVLAGGGAGPAHTLIGDPNGSGFYASANGSIEGNGAHNPFLAGTLTFHLLVPGATSETTISDVIFSFGTTSGNNIDGTCTEGCGGQVPAPSGFMLIATALVGSWSFKRLTRRTQQERA